MTLNDFDVSFVRGLNIEDGAATLTDFTASIIGEKLYFIFKKIKKKSRRSASLWWRKKK